MPPRRQPRSGRPSQGRPRGASPRILGVDGTARPWAAAPSEARLVLEIDGRTAAHLRAAARARQMLPEALLADILRRGLQQEIQRLRAEAALKALTPREREIAALIAHGLTNRQAAETLVISPETVKSHIRSILAKFGLHSKAQLQLLLRDFNPPQEQENRPPEAP